jgi:radical SAM superfamily enzyme YgiQ (UPF0313 family)
MKSKMGTSAPVMKKRILLINPWIYDFAAYDFWIKPLGLLCLASFLRKNGYHVDLVDCLDPWNVQMRNVAGKKLPRRFQSGHGKYFKEVIPKPDTLKGIPKNYHRYGITPQIFHEALLSLPRCDMVFVTSMMTYWYPGVFEVIRIVKKLMLYTPVVLGGNYVTLCPDHARLSGADFLLTGEGEEKITQLLKKEWAQELEFVPDSSNLDSYPYPAFDLINHPEQLPVMTSRGCPFQCTYCASRLLNPHFRRRNPTQVFAEILHWHKHLGVRNFSFYDDAFLVKPDDMAIPLLREIVKHALPCQFHCPNGLHLRELTDEIAGLMFKAGFRTIRFGFETADAGRQSETGGKATNRELQNAIKYLKKAGYRGEDIGIYLLCGMPWQAAEEVRESILFVKSCGAKPILAEYSPIPGTELWEAAVKASPFNIAEEPLFQNNTLLPCRAENFTYEMYLSLKQLTRID